MSKVTMQDIADKLSTSRITVWKALNNHQGVSNDFREKIIQTAQEMGYLKSNIPTESTNIPVVTSHTKTVAAVVSRPESSAFWMQIIHIIAKKLSKHGINLMYTYMPSYYQEGYTLPTSLTNGSVSGIIVLNIYSQELLQMLSQLNLPKVFLDTVPSIHFDELHGDILMIEGRNIVKKITSRLLAAGITDIGFVGDINYAQTNTDRYNGYNDAFEQYGLQVNRSICRIGKIGLKIHYEEIRSFLASLKPFPKAFVCASDYIAHFIKRYCDENKIDLSDDLILTGFDNNTEYANVAGLITTVDVQTDMIGMRLANKILFRMEHSNASYEVTYVNSKIIYRGILSI